MSFSSRRPPFRLIESPPGNSYAQQESNERISTGLPVQSQISTSENAVRRPNISLKPQRCQSYSCPRSSLGGFNRLRFALQDTKCGSTRFLILNTESGYQLETQNRVAAKAKPGMALSPSRYSVQPRLTASSPESKTRSSMSLAVQHPPPKLPEIVRFADRRPLELPTRPRSSSKIELPPIRHMLQDIELGPRIPEVALRTDPESSSISAPTITSRQRQPEHTSSPVPNKRRRLSHEEDEFEYRDSVAIRLDRWNQSRLVQQPQSAAISPQLSDRRMSSYSTESWISQPSTTRTSPYSSSGPTARPQSPPYDPRPTWQPSRLTLPSLPSLSQAATTPRPRSSFNEYALDSCRATAPPFPQLPRPSFDPPMAYHHDPQPSFTPYGYQQPRGLSYSGPLGYAVTHDRTPFSAGIHHGYAQSSYSYRADNAEDTGKQRKRRGNLPKETTDILRAWFMAHLQHPYPTEDEKQALMTQTRLQMNQISNWFINARRRQLPAMINNARAESDARSARSGPDKDYGDGERNRGVGSVSDSESQYGQEDDEYDMQARGVSLGRSRERDSI